MTVIICYVKYHILRSKMYSPPLTVTRMLRQTVPLPNASSGDVKGSVADSWQLLTADNQRR